MSISVSQFGRYNCFKAKNKGTNNQARHGPAKAFDFFVLWLNGTTHLCVIKLRLKHCNTIEIKHILIVYVNGTNDTFDTLNSVKAGKKAIKTIQNKSSFRRGWDSNPRVQSTLD